MRQGQTFIWEFSPTRAMPVEVGLEADVAEGKARCVTANGRPLALFKVAGRIYALENRCTHLGGPLCQGFLKESTVTCPWHGSRFDVRTGQVVGPPARTPVHSVPVIVEGGKVFADVS